MDSYTFANMMNEAARNQGVNPDYTDEVMQKMLDYQSGKLQYGLDAVADGSKWEDRWTKDYANTDIFPFDPFFVVTSITPKGAREP